MVDCLEEAAILREYLESQLGFKIDAKLHKLDHDQSHVEEEKIVVQVGNGHLLFRRRHIGKLPGGPLLVSGVGH